MNGNHNVVSMALSIVLLLTSMCTFATEQIACPKCQKAVTEAFCTNCGTPRPGGGNSEQPNAMQPNGDKDELPSQSYDMPYPVGMFRGLAEMLFSPANVLRGSVGATVEVLNMGGKPNAISVVVATCIMGPFGAVGGCFPMIGDLCVGAADFLTFGAIGNETEIWKDGVSSPYIFERCWVKAESHGQKSAYFYFVK